MKILICDKCKNSFSLTRKDDNRKGKIRSVEVVDEFGELYHRADLCPSCLLDFYKWIGVSEN